MKQLSLIEIVGLAQKSTWEEHRFNHEPSPDYSELPSFSIDAPYSEDNYTGRLNNLVIEVSVTEEEYRDEQGRICYSPFGYELNVESIIEGSTDNLCLGSYQAESIDQDLEYENLKSIRKTIKYITEIVKIAKNYCLAERKRLKRTERYKKWKQKREKEKLREDRLREAKKLIK